MKKHNRQELILNIIRDKIVETQRELAKELNKRQINTTQATISRDVKELGLTKVQADNGRYRYAQLDNHDGDNDKVKSKGIIFSIEKSDNLVILKTNPYRAKICAIDIDNAKIPQILGTIAGHDTIFIAIKKKSDIDEVIYRLKQILI